MKKSIIDELIENPMLNHNNNPKEDVPEYLTPEVPLMCSSQEDNTEDIINYENSEQKNTDMYRTNHSLGKVSLIQGESEDGNNF